MALSPPPLSVARWFISSDYEIEAKFRNHVSAWRFAWRRLATLCMWRLVYMAFFVVGLQRTLIILRKVIWVEYICLLICQYLMVDLFCFDREVWWNFTLHLTVLLIVNHNLPRYQWRFGTIVAYIMSNKRYIRIIILAIRIMPSVFDVGFGIGDSGAVHLSGI